MAATRKKFGPITTVTSWLLKLPSALHQYQTEPSDVAEFSVRIEEPGLFSRDLIQDRCHTPSVIT